ncbi:hypothetical protein ACVWY0_002505 [Arthrobacter sp. UYNi723]
MTLQVLYGKQPETTAPELTTGFTIFTGFTSEYVKTSNSRKASFTGFTIFTGFTSEYVKTSNSRKASFTGYTIFTS